MSMNADDVVSIAPPSEQLRLQIGWDKRMGITSNPVRYNKTAALLLYWCEDDSDLATENEVFNLRQVFQEEYNFKVYTAAMNTKRSPALQAKSHLTSFVDTENDTHTLLIVYYAGHGWSKVSTDGNIMLTGKQEHDDKYSIDWASVEWALKGTDADVLLVFDCCHAGLLCQPFTRSRPESCVQILAACQNHQTTRKAGKESFTQALIYALLSLKSKRSFSTLNLLHTIITAPDFPRHEQTPQLSHRFGESRPDCIHIARMAQDEEAPLSPVLDYKQQQYLDVRLHFPHELNDNTIWETCDALRTLVTKKEISARQIHLIGKNRLAPYVEKAARTFHSAFLESRERRKYSNSQVSTMPAVETPSFDVALAAPSLEELNQELRPAVQSQLAPSLYLPAPASLMFRVDEHTLLLPQTTFIDGGKARPTSIAYRLKTVIQRLFRGLASIFRKLDHVSGPECRDMRDTHV